LKCHEEQLVTQRTKELNKRFNQWFDKEEKRKSSLGATEQVARE